MGEFQVHKAATIAFLAFFLYSLLFTTCMAQELSGSAWEKDVDGHKIVAIELNLAEGDYLYHTDLGEPGAIGMPLQIALSGSKYSIESFTTSKPKVKEQESYKQPGKKLKVNVHTSRAYLYLKLRQNLSQPKDDGTLSNPENLQIYLRGQICNKQRCLPQSLTISVKKSGKSPEAENAFAIMPQTGQFSPPLAAWEKFAQERNNSQPAVPCKAFGKFGRQCNVSSGSNVCSQKMPESIITALDSTVNDKPADLPKFNIRSEKTEYSFFVWMGFSLVAGMLLNFMPCVLPVISLKIMGFVNQAHESRKRLILLSLSFSAGIITVFLALGLAAVSFGLQWGEQFQSETFNIILVCLVFAFSLSFFGVYELEAPEIAAKLQSGNSLPREGLLGAYCTGLLATLMATPCSGPFLGATISWALTQTAIMVISVFFCLGVGMALPYFLLSASSWLRKFLPKPGAWMITFRVCMGFVLLLTVIYLMLFIQAQNLLSTCALMIFIAFACWIFGKYVTILHRRRVRWAVRVIAAGIITVGAFLSFGVFKPVLARGVMAEAKHYKNAGTGQTSEAPHSSGRHPFDFTSFRKDLADGKNVLVKFTADWCPNCQYNSHYVFSSDPVLKELKDKGVVFYEADLTDDNPQTRKMRELLKSIGGSAIPYVGIFPADTPDRPYVLPDLLTVSKVMDTLDRLPTPSVGMGKVF